MSGRPLTPTEFKCNKKIILYVTDEEKKLYQRRAEEKGQSVSTYIRRNLSSITKKLRELYAGQTQEEKEN